MVERLTVIYALFLCSWLSLKQTTGYKSKQCPRNPGTYTKVPLTIDQYCEWTSCSNDSSCAVLEEPNCYDYCLYCNYDDSYKCDALVGTGEVAPKNSKSNYLQFLCSGPLFPDILPSYFHRTDCWSGITPDGDDDSSSDYRSAFLYFIILVIVLVVAVLVLTGLIVLFRKWYASRQKFVEIEGNSPHHIHTASLGISLLSYFQIFLLLIDPPFFHRRSK